MAEQDPDEQVRPFMSKQTYDAVSFMFSGSDPHDYETHYLATRAHWDDSSIHDEALFWHGFAHGLGTGAIEYLRHDIMQRDQYSSLGDVNSNDRPRPGNAVHLAPDARVPAQQPANPDKAAKAQDRNIAETFEVPPAPNDGRTTLSVPLSLTNIPSRTKETLVTTARKERKHNFMTPIIESLAKETLVTTARKKRKNNIMTPMIESLAVGIGFDEVMEHAAREW